MLQLIFSEKRVKNLKQTLICIRHILNTYFYSITITHSLSSQNKTAALEKESQLISATKYITGIMQK
jgi:hypothetical protein